MSKKKHGRPQRAATGAATGATAAPATPAAKAAAPVTTPVSTPVTAPAAASAPAAAEPLNAVDVALGATPHGVSTGAAPDPMMPDVWAPAPEAAPASADAPAVDAAADEVPNASPEATPDATPADAPDEAPVGAPAVVSPVRDARVGLFVGREWSFPPAFLRAVERRDAGVVAEYAQIGAPRFDEPAAYDLCIDRISHEVPVYRTYLKQAALQGTTVVNNPFMWSADDKFFGAALADRLGVASPKTVVLPNREYVEGIVPSESLRNLEYPLDWEGIARYVGLPCVLKDAHGGGWKEVYICDSVEELIRCYDQSGRLTMIVQEFIRFEHFVRCLVIGREHVLPMKYDPKHRRYVVDHAHLTPELGSRIVRDARTLCSALGYDMNSMEFAIRDGVPYAIDFMNPAPDMDVNSLTPTYFEWAVEQMADMAVRLATAARDGARDRRDPSWGTVFGGRAARAPEGHDSRAGIREGNG